MNKAMLLIHHSFDASSFAVFVCTIFLINAAAATLPAASSLHVEFSSKLNTSRCVGEKWGRFFNGGCCSGVEFCAYLYALSIRANQTGEISLSLDEQRNCSSNGVCGGGCFNFSTLGVKNELRFDLQRLESECGTTHSCSSCVRRWEEIKKSTEICGVAVLITLISAEVENQTWASSFFRCLGSEQISSDAEVAEGAERKRIGAGFYLVVGGVVVVAVFTVLILARRRNKKAIAPVDKEATLSSRPAPSPLLNASGILNVSVEEIQVATNNLGESNFIGEGTAGKVYRGVMSNNQHVAIKKITNDETFVREITSLVHVKHPNLVPLLGYCENESECFLIYELCPNGNLSDWLFAGRDKALSWVQRLEIAVGSARGLRFLHTHPEGSIIHRDVKPANILLGTNLEAKLSDFGLSKVMSLGESSVSSEIRGTFGYVDPDYQTNCHISAASDVYSFGVVLLQILSGRKVIDMNMKQPKPLDKIAKSVVKTGKMVDFADANLDGEFSVDAFVLVFELAMSCTGKRRRRPSMMQVVVKLEEALSISEKMEATSTPDWSIVP